ncbi:MAG: efflux RND transporter periplasmic adaptor subunit [Sedimentisphaerales bacterium]|nr:efflux RND transporter periplasmic adaptor subunit [Sedimentisphaerales bacterium]
MKKLIIIIAIILGIFIIAGFIGTRLKISGKIGQGNPTLVRLEKPQLGELVEFINAPGEIEPKKKVEISAKVAARIIELPYKEGQRVTKGDPNANPPISPSVLVRLDSSDLEAAMLSTRARRSAQAAQIEVSKVEINSRKASVEGVKASLDQAWRKLRREQQLLESNDISQSTLDETQSRVEELQAQYDSSVSSLKAAQLGLNVLAHNLEAADAEISRARENLKYTTITSPIDGIITQLNAEEGEIVMTGTMNNPGTVIMVVADLSRMLLVAQVDEIDIPRVKVGQPAKVHIQAWPDEIFEGVVDKVALAQTINRMGSKYYEVEVLLDNTEKRVLTGFSADVDIEIQRHQDVLRVPSQAVVGRKIDELPLDIRENNPLIDKTKLLTEVVYRAIDGKAVVTPVKMGKSDAMHTIILEGLTQDDQVIIGPYKILEGLNHEQLVKDEKEAEKEKQEKENNNVEGKGKEDEADKEQQNEDEQEDDTEKTTE